MWTDRRPPASLPPSNTFPLWHHHAGAPMRRREVLMMMRTGRRRGCFGAAMQAVRRQDTHDQHTNCSGERVLPLAHHDRCAQIQNSKPMTSPRACKRPSSTPPPPPRPHAFVHPAAAAAASYRPPHPAAAATAAAASSMLAMPCAVQRMSALARPPSAHDRPLMFLPGPLCTHLSKMFTTSPRPATSGPPAGPLPAPPRDS